MSEYLMREDSPLSESEWSAIDDAVVASARQNMVARRVLSIYGPLGAGLEAVHTNVFGNPTDGAVSYTGEADNDPVEAKGRAVTPLMIVHKDFRIGWRELELAHQLKLPIDTSAASAAGVFAARAEDSLIFFGNKESGITGLLNADGRNKLKLTDWSTPPAAVENLVSAVTLLREKGFTQPHAAILSPNLYSSLLKVREGGDSLELEFAKTILSGGVFESPSLGANQGIVLALGPQNFDLAVGQDLVTGYLEAVNMNHVLRVFETIALRIKRPGAICTLEK